MSPLPTTVQTSLGKTLHLTKQIGKGGEGAIYETREQTDIVVKLYWPTKAADRKEKVSAMASAAWYRSTAIVAFPMDIIFGPMGAFVGYVMKKAEGYKPLHLLYSPANRKLEFQKANFQFLVRTAGNIARAVASVHATGCVIGDINHSGFLISEAATSVLIDSDSFQVITATQNFFCRVGTPEYTPPEMQGSRFDRIKRTLNHDNFGLAVLIFQLLFLGKHPFAGRYSGQGDMPLERAIGEFRFAYSADSRTQMQAPPGAPLLSDFPADVSQAFEQAFGRNGTIRRPSATEWISILMKLESELEQCAFDKSHHHVKGKPCPWCRIEKAMPGFVAFIQDINLDTRVDIAGVLALIRSIKDPGATPEIQSILNVSGTLAPSIPTIRALAQLKRKAILTTGATALGCALVFLSGPGILPGFILIGAGLFSNYLEPNQLKMLRDLKVQSEASWNSAQVAWNGQPGNQKYLQLKAEADILVRALNELPIEERRGVVELEQKKRELQLHRYLDRFRIADAKIRKFASGRKAILASYGIETAADIEQVALEAIPGFGEALIISLIAWRKSLTNKFVFNPGEPLNPQDIRALKLKLTNKRRELDRKIRICVSELKKVSDFTIDQRRKLADAAHQAFVALNQAQFDESAATGPTYKVSKIAPFLFAALAGFYITHTNPSATKETASSAPSLQMSERKSEPVTVRNPAAEAKSKPSTPSSLPPHQATASRATPLSAYSQDGRGIAAPQALPNSLSAPVLGAPRIILPAPDIYSPAAPGVGVAPETRIDDILNPLKVSDALRIQERLIALGYLSGRADGKWGPMSKRALQEFRRSQGIHVTDLWDRQTQGVLFDVSAPNPNPFQLLFTGGWTPEPSACEPGQPPPLTITAQKAETRDNNACQFTSFRPDGIGVWRVTAICKVDGVSRPANIRFAVAGSILHWKSENQDSTYYRCP